jgi:hypothetical protein
VIICPTELQQHKEQEVAGGAFFILSLLSFLSYLVKVTIQLLLASCLPHYLTGSCLSTWAFLLPFSLPLALAPLFSLSLSSHPVLPSPFPGGHSDPVTATQPQCHPSSFPSLPVSFPMGPNRLAPNLVFFMLTL